MRPFPASGTQGSIIAVQYCPEHGSPLGREAGSQPLEPRQVPPSATGQAGVCDAFPDGDCRNVHACSTAASPVSDDPPPLLLVEHAAQAKATMASACFMADRMRDAVPARYWRPL
jgi:hypothetical protein